MPSALLVSIDVLPIPDRIDKGQLRLCVQMTPAGAGSPGGNFDLSAWPSEVARRTGAMRLVIARLSAGRPVLHGWQTIGKSDTFDLFSTTPDLISAVTDKWKGIFRAKTDQFGDLYNWVTESEREAVRAFSAVMATPPVAADTHDLDLLLDQIYGRSAGRISTLSVGGVQGLLNPEEWAILARAFDFQTAEAQRAQGMSTASSLKTLAADPAAAAAYVRSEAKAYAARRERMQGAFATQTSDTSLCFTDTQLAHWGETIAQFAQAVGDGGPPPDAPEPPDQPSVEAWEHPRRKLAAMLSFPTIAKYFGLCTDLLLDPGALANLEEGLLAVELKEPDGDFPATPDVNALRWTAFRYARPPSRTGHFFGAWDGTMAAPRPSQALEIDGYRDGLLNLQQKVHNVPQFQLGNSDVANAALRAKEKAERLTEAFRSGARALDMHAALDERASKGIVLFRTTPAQQLVADHLDITASVRGPTINYAKDLVHGLRFDMLLLTPDGQASTDRWRPLMARIVDYPDLDERFLRCSAVQAVRYRDDAVGIVPDGERSRWDSNGNKTCEKFVLNELMQWAGGSLAVAADARATQIDAEQDLAISVAFDLPDDRKNRAHCAPPLRFGRQYRVRARIAMPMGCGLTFDDVQADPGAEDYVLPAKNGFDVERHEKLRAPEVLLPWDGSLVTASDSVAPDDRRDGRTIDQLVIRDTGADYATDSRFLLPARASLEDWERHGILDDHRYDGQSVPAGAFEGVAKVVLYGQHGAFPEARAGAVVWQHDENEFRAESGGLSSDTIKQRKPRGSVLVMDPRAAARQRALYPDPPPSDVTKHARPRYYPDPLSRVAVVSLTSSADFSNAVGGGHIDFWQSGGHPAEATPGLLRVRRGRDGNAVTIASGTSRVRPPNGGTLSLPTLTVTLPPAAIVDVVLRADASDASLADGHAMAKLTGAVGPASINANLQDRRTLRLVHAVQRPLRAPSVSGQGMKAVSVNVRADNSTASDPPTWRERVEHHWFDSVEGGATTFFIGEVRAHRGSTGRLLCDATWSDFGPTCIRKDPQTGLWSMNVPEDAATLFQIESVTGSDQLDVDLTVDEHGQPRGLAYSFRDGRARRLRPRLIATSRFTNFFSPALAGSEINGVGLFDSASPGGENAPSIWTRCTFRPPPPVVDRALPILLWDERARRDRYSSERRSLLRIFLDPQWYASGEGEKLALVFDATPQDVCAYQAPAMEPFAGFLTRWGRDPIRVTDPVGPLRPEHVIGGVKPAGTFELQPGADDFGGVPTAGSHTVRIVALTPQVDPDLGLYCDIEFGGAAFDDALRSYMPFVQLGLARYQEHSVKGLELSRPVEYTVQLIPDRRAVVTVTGSRRLQIDLHGQVFAPPPQAETYLHIRMMERRQEVLAGGVPGERYWLPVLDERDRVVEARTPLSRSNEAGQTDLIATSSLTVPHDFESAAYGILVEEYEVMPGDPPDRYENLSSEDAMADTIPTVRGPLFMTTINLTRSS